MKIRTQLQDIYSLSTWVDEINNSGNMRDCIANAIDRSRCFIIFFTSNYNEKIRTVDLKDYCFYEMNYALINAKLGTRKTILVILEESMLHTNEWASRFQAEFANVRYINFTKWNSDNPNFPTSTQTMDELAVEIYRILSLP